jgi:alpha-L-fucosidase 2
MATISPPDKASGSIRSHVGSLLPLFACQLLAMTTVAASQDQPFQPAERLAACDVVWDSPSKNALGSMPSGNGDIGINAWVEETGDLVFYISKTDAWDENARLCKIGRVRVKFDPALNVKDGFRQQLKLRDGVIEISGKLSATKSQVPGSNTQTTVTDNRSLITDNFFLRLWVDANQPVVRVDVDSAVAVTCRAEVELWRLRERPFGSNDDPHSAAGLSAHAYKPTVLPDVVVPASAPQVLWYHRNTRSIHELSLQVQHLDGLIGKFGDPLLNRTFGASMRGEGFVADGKQALKSAAPAKRQSLAITVLTAQTATPEAWLAQLATLEQQAAKTDLAKARLAHVAWWQAFWDRSWIFVDGGAEAVTLTRDYVLQRYMNACSGRGGSPIKFNGSIFTVEKQPGASPETPEGNPDWRLWGGNYWFQNTRLAYWPMLATGDFEMMDPWFRMHRDALPLGKARVESYYKFTNAAVFPETMYFWGLPNNGDYGWRNSAPEPANSYIRRHWSGGLELAAVMLDRYDFTQDRQFAKDTLVPLADPLIAFLDQYWPKRDANGKIIMDPAQSLETFHSAVNPMPEVAGLHHVLPRLLALPADLTTEAQRARWTRLLKELPPVPVADVSGVKLLRPAATVSGSSNSENPELYAVFPFPLYGVGRPDLAMARATYDKRTNRHNRGWCQDSIQAACLGLGDEAGRLLAARAAIINSGHRFPVMWGPNFDWIPDQDHGNNILTTMQRMVLQTDGNKLYLMPAWPKSWNVTFKLHAPGNTTVAGTVRNGKVVSLEVTPQSRAADVINMLDK